MKTEYCKTCDFFGPECFLGNDGEPICYALCHKPSPVYDWVPHNHWCTEWRQRQGEPLGTGLSRVWLAGENFWGNPAAFIHDMNESSEANDKLWLRNMQTIANWTSTGLKRAYRNAFALAGYPIITAFRLIARG